MAAALFRDKPIDVPLWLEARGLTLLGVKAEKVLTDLYAESAWFGVSVARAEIRYAETHGKADNPTISVDWDGWVPGDPDAARLLLSKSYKGAGYQNLLDRSNITISGINETRIAELGNVLSRSVGAGDSMATTSANIREKFKVSKEWADTVAQTETRRAVTAASLDTYKDSEIEWVSWLTSDGGCPECAEYEAMGPVRIGEGAFDGEDGPPGHPNCFCVILPEAGYEPKTVDPDLTKAGRNVIGEALAKLADIPDVKPGQIAVPWKSTTRPKLDPEVWEESILKSVAIKDLTATQATLNRGRVKYFINNPGNVEDNRRAYANVYDSEGIEKIIDGHHRLAALWLLGADSANVWFLEA